ncbi:hypothetical protein EYF80_003024 [Liparis tanakae]|uniref:Uncharacterized protein n=1 Tax=Liparis tanakae TaxID=230148 RepID=A0A4Z2JA77_9TELE|nr:hypothetical protein EYF80_003024 [Liparis tanakae]
MAASARLCTVSDAVRPPADSARHRIPASAASYRDFGVNSNRAQPDPGRITSPAHHEQLILILKVKNNDDTTEVACHHTGLERQPLRTTCAWCWRELSILQTSSAPSGESLGLGTHLCTPVINQALGIDADGFN